VTRTVKKCWGEHGSQGNSYGCLPLGLLAIQRIGEKYCTNVHEAQLDALVSIWASIPQEDKELGSSAVKATAKERLKAVIGKENGKQQVATETQRQKSANAHSIAYMKPSMALCNVVGGSDPVKHYVVPDDDGNEFENM